MDKMLEKNNIFDAHFHLSDCMEQMDLENFIINGCSSCHSENDYNKVLAFKGKVKSSENICISFGIHPQNPDFSLLNVLENLLAQGKISAIGECGFDFFTPEYKETVNEQKKVFEAQLELALKFNKPMIIHCRKANELLFAYSKELKKVPSILFHSFMGSIVEAESFLKRGINGYFSFGKQIFNNNKNVIQLVSELSLENLLCETDAPYQTLKGEKWSKPSEIEEIYKGALILRKEKIDYAGFIRQLELNFRKLYNF